MSIVINDTVAGVSLDFDEIQKSLIEKLLADVSETES